MRPGVEFEDWMLDVTCSWRWPRSLRSAPAAAESGQLMEDDATERVQSHESKDGDDFRGE